MHNGEQETEPSCGTIALECAAFLNGTLAEYWDDKGMDVPVWAWMNLLAHGTARQIGECVLRPYRPRRSSRNWHIARAYLAYEVLDLTDLEFTLARDAVVGPDPSGARDVGPPRGRPPDAPAVGRPGRRQPALPARRARSSSGRYDERRCTQRSTVRVSAGRGRIPTRSMRSWNSRRSNRSPSRSAASARNRTISRRPTM